MKEKHIQKVKLINKLKNYMESIEIIISLMRIKIKIYCTKVALLMIYLKGMEDKFILIKVTMKVNLNKVRKKDLENLFRQMANHILDHGNKMIEMDLENIFTPMDIMKENSSKITEKEMDHTFIIMGQYSKAIGIPIGLSPFALAIAWSTFG